MGKIKFIPLVLNLAFTMQSWMTFSRIGNFAHTVACLQNWQPMVGNIGTIGYNVSTNGTNGRTLVPLTQSHLILKSS